VFSFVALVATPALASRIYFHATYELQTLKFLVLFTDKIFCRMFCPTCKKFVLGTRYYDCRHGSGHV